MEKEIGLEIPKIIQKPENGVTFDPRYPHTNSQDDQDEIDELLKTDEDTDEDYQHTTSSKIDPKTDKELEQKVIQTFLKIMNQVNPDSLGDIQHQHLSKILIDDNSQEGSRERSQERDVLINNPSEEKKLFDSNIRESMETVKDNYSVERNPENGRINYVAKSVKFPKHSERIK